MNSFPSHDQLKDIIQLAKREDLGTQNDDVTSRLLVDQNTIGVGTLLQKGVGITCGLPIVEMICRAYDERLRVEQIPGFHMEVIEGRFSDARVTPLLRIRGPLRARFARAAERDPEFPLAGHDGCARHAHPALRQTRRRLGRQDLRHPQDHSVLRPSTGYAVRAGGGVNHRTGLYDGLLVKDNHLAAQPLKELSSFLARIVSQCRSEDSNRLIEIEVDTLDQLREVLKVEGVDVILLDNMDCPKMTQAVELRDRAHSASSGQAHSASSGQAHSASSGQAGKKGKVELEASGGVTLETVRSIALTGVERIAVGAITHSATALDIGLEVE